MRRILPLLAVLWVACGPGAGSRSSAPGAVDAPARPKGGSPSPQAPGGPDRAACVKDEDCTFASLGCCHTTPVHRGHAAAAQAELQASGLQECPPKAACGPGGDGTWKGTRGVCTAGKCGCDPRHPLFSNCAGR